MRLCKPLLLFLCAWYKWEMALEETWNRSDGVGLQGQVQAQGSPFAQTSGVLNVFTLNRGLQTPQKGILTLPSGPLSLVTVFSFFSSWLIVFEVTQVLPNPLSGFPDL